MTDSGHSNTIGWGPAPPRGEMAVGCRPHGRDVLLMVKLPEFTSPVIVPMSQREAHELRVALKQAIQEARR